MEVKFTLLSAVLFLKGAFYDRAPFISNDFQTPAKVVVSDSSASFIFDGQLGGSKDYYPGYVEMSVIFTTDGFLPERYENLILLNDTTIDLENPGWQVMINKEGGQYEADILEGFIEFKKAQRLLVDKEQKEVILSGRFGFRAVVEDEPVNVSNGRFDLGVGERNFFKWGE